MNTRNTPIRPLPAPVLASNYGHHGNPASAWPTGLTVTATPAQGTWSHRATITATPAGGAR